MCNQLPNLFSELLEAATSAVQRGLGYSEFGDSRAAVIESAMGNSLMTSRSGGYRSNG